MIVGVSELTFVPGGTVNVMALPLMAAFIPSKLNAVISLALFLAMVTVTV
jgi:hypothetical protein